MLYLRVELLQSVRVLLLEELDILLDRRAAGVRVAVTGRRRRRGDRQLLRLARRTEQCKHTQTFIPGQTLIFSNKELRSTPFLFWRPYIQLRLMLNSNMID
ncbi:hypothetical protein EYF80_033289 [Liparis tanakae]|uniref:Uncharacterized protein n=1 Tax=Liparis tanakae TaxID=230148 RepID=A0A4Z2GUT1_9TELE|nr:hypothetical protein EYF80_033289 [Liparis tanakae]